IHAWGGRQPAPATPISFLLPQAMAWHPQWDRDEAQASIPSPPVRLRAQRDMLVKAEDGSLAFRYRRHWEWLLAWQAFHQPDSQLPAPAVWPRVVQFYREQAWAHLLSEVTPSRLFLRLRDQEARIPATDLDWSRLADISRLYLSDPLPADLRILSVLPELRGIYLNEALKAPGLPQDLLHALPHQGTMVYFPRKSGWQAWRAQRLPIEGPAGSSVLDWQAYHPLERLNLWTGKLSDPAAGDQRILRLLPPGWNQWPQPGDKDELVTGTGAPLETRIASRRLAPAWQDMMDQMRRYRRPDGQVHLLLENRFRPTLFVEYLTNLVQQLVLILGEDDEHRGAFSLDDTAQVEDGYWTGRRWTRQNTDRYAYPVLLYLESPWQVRFWILGLAD
ncbi:MAG: hypothetical protein D6722_25560, partial [Bacteroidetes bacterium]